MTGAPGAARVLLTLITPPDRRGVIAGDLEEEFAERAGAGGDGLGAARRWYWRSLRRGGSGRRGCGPATAAGIYGVASYSVSARVREIGVRLALGAEARGVRHMVVRQALIPVVLGAVVGLAVSFATAGFLQGMVHGVGAGDIPTRLAVAALLVAVAVTASWIPALRASRLDPAVTLRQE